MEKKDRRFVQLRTPADGCCFLYSVVAIDQPLLWASCRRNPLGFPVDIVDAEKEKLQKENVAVQLLQGLAERPNVIDEFKRGRLFDFSELHQLSMHRKQRIRITLHSSVAEYARTNGYPSDMTYGNPSWPLLVHCMFSLRGQVKSEQRGHFEPLLPVDSIDIKLWRTRRVYGESVIIEDTTKNMPDVPKQPIRERDVAAEEENDDIKKAYRLSMSSYEEEKRKREDDDVEYNAQVLALGVDPFSGADNDLTCQGHQKDEDLSIRACAKSEQVAPLAVDIHSPPCSPTVMDVEGMCQTGELRLARETETKTQAEWICNRCTLVNKNSNATCEACEASNPNQDITPPVTSYPIVIDNGAPNGALGDKSRQWSSLPASLLKRSKLTATRSFKVALEEIDGAEDQEQTNTVQKNLGKSDIAEMEEWRKSKRAAAGANLVGHDLARAKIPPRSQEPMHGAGSPLPHRNESKYFLDAKDSGGSQGSQWGVAAVLGPAMGNIHPINAFTPKECATSSTATLSARPQSTPRGIVDVAAARQLKDRVKADQAKPRINRQEPSHIPVPMQLPISSKKASPKCLEPSKDMIHADADLRQSQAVEAIERFAHLADCANDVQEIDGIVVKPIGPARSPRGQISAESSRAGRSRCTTPQISYQKTPESQGVAARGDRTKGRETLAYLKLKGQQQIPNEKQTTDAASQGSKGTRKEGFIKEMCEDGVYIQPDDSSIICLASFTEFPVQECKKAEAVMDPRRGSIGDVRVSFSWDGNTDSDRSYGRVGLVENVKLLGEERRKFKRPLSVLSAPRRRSFAAGRKRQKLMKGTGSETRETGQTAITIKPKWLDLILMGKKTWEIRGCNCHKRGLVRLAESKEEKVSSAGKITGEAIVEDSMEVTLEILEQNLDKHCIPVDGLRNFPYKRFYAWVLRDARRFEIPQNYEIKGGSITWRKLDTETVRRCNEESAKSKACHIPID